MKWILRSILFFGVIILVGRLTELQVIKGEYYRNLADNNRIREMPIIAARGKLLARGGEDFQLQMNFAHLSGYLGEVNEDEVGKINPRCIGKGPHSLGSQTGRGGLEEFYDCTLRGIDGEELIEVDSMGRKVRSLGRREPIPGDNLQTTIDFNLQNKIAESMQGKKGIVVATDPNGEVLAFYSSPSFDPNNISPSLVDSDLPLFNRLIGGVYHPGSIFKIVTSTASLEEGTIDKNFLYTDTGIITIGDFSYTNWYFTQYGRTEGAINISKALSRSTDTFFYKAGEIMGVDNLVKWSKNFKLDQKTNIDLPGEIESLVPSPEWKKKVKKENWFLGNTYHMAIGQGDLALTPISVHRIISVIAANGKLCDLKINTQKPSQCEQLPIKKSTLETIKEGLLGACSDGGTAYPFFDFKPQAACKTGTAETEEIDKTHAWFTMYAPANDPQIVLTVLVEKGGEGSSVAAPIAKEILTNYFLDKQYED